MPSKYSLIASKTKAACLKEFENIGLELVDLLINAINPPKSVQEIMDKKSHHAFEYCHSSSLRNKQIIHFKKIF